MITALRPQTLTATPLRAAAASTALPAEAPPSQPQETFTPPAPAQPIKSGDFRTAMGKFPTGATIITTGKGADRHGMTASSFHSVSLEPCLVSFCAANGSGTLAALEHNGSFAVNVLAEDQTGPCFRFADKKIQDRFADQPFHEGPVTGAPLLDGASARFECKVWQIIPAGDHQIVLGQVVGMDSCDAKPLLFVGGKALTRVIP